MPKTKKILLSFVGSNDAGAEEKKDGAILTALKNEKFDEIILIWNKSGNFDFEKITKNLVVVIKKRKLAKTVNSIEFDLKDVTDHNEIYKRLKDFTDTLDKSNEFSYTASISSGTPAMQVCWILLAESGDFSEDNKLRLIRVLDPRYTKSKNAEVKLDTTLPKIIKLKNENISLKKDLIPPLIIEVEKGIIKVGDTIIDFSPIEFSYYRYFAERAKEGLGLEKFSDLFIPNHFLEKVYHYHSISFPVLDLNRIEYERAKKSGTQFLMSTFRGNITKINNKIKQALDNQTLIENFQISSEGKRGAKFYGIKVSGDKIIIKDE